MGTMSKKGLALGHDHEGPPSAPPPDYNEAIAMTSSPSSSSGILARGSTSTTVSLSVTSLPHSLSVQRSPMVREYTLTRAEAKEALNESTGGSDGYKFLAVEQEPLRYRFEVDVLVEGRKVILKSEPWVEIGDGNYVPPTGDAHENFDKWSVTAKAPTIMIGKKSTYHLKRTEKKVVCTKCNGGGMLSCGHCGGAGKKKCHYGVDGTWQCHKCKNNGGYKTCSVQTCFGGKIRCGTCNGEKVLKTWKNVEVDWKPLTWKFMSDYDRGDEVPKAEIEKVIGTDVSNPVVVGGVGEKWPVAETFGYAATIAHEIKLYLKDDDVKIIRLGEKVFEIPVWKVKFDRPVGVEVSRRERGHYYVIGGREGDRIVWFPKRYRDQGCCVIA